MSAILRPIKCGVRRVQARTVGIIKQGDVYMMPLFKDLVDIVELCYTLVGIADIAILQI